MGAGQVAAAQRLNVDPVGKAANPCRTIAERPGPVAGGKQESTSPVGDRRAIVLSQGRRDCR
ncbi:MAG: hypothetical protein GQ524_05880 [Anaerolineales bacterium]|nr:hypothetical protein [Anaerolineales bacterium]